MPTQYIQNAFSNYFTTVTFSHSLPIEEDLQLAAISTFVDIFAYLPQLSCWILCWSATASNTANRVFIPDSHSAFQSLQKTAKILHFLKPTFVQENPHEHDIALLALQSSHDMVALVPIADESDTVVGAIRIIGSENSLNTLGFKKDGAGFVCATATPSLTIPDPDLIPHVLGRWAGSNYGHRGTNRVPLLLNCFSSFFSKSHNMFYRRDFNSDVMEFSVSTTPATQKIIGGLRASIHDHRYMFSIVAERGASEIVDSFPDDLPSDLRLNYTQWEPNEIYFRLKEAIDAKKTSYIGIPLKVDDAVVGVFTLLTPFGCGRFADAARFMRSTLAEMGRTVDKKAMTRSSQIVRGLSRDISILDASENSVPQRCTALIDSLVKQLVPFGKLTVGFIEARLGAAPNRTHDLPKNVLGYLQESLPDLVLSGSITLYIPTKKPSTDPIAGVIVTPITAPLPFIVYVFGPVSLLTGRTLRTALEQLQATVNLSLTAAEGAVSANLELSNWRGHLALWAKLHELKNRTASFAKPLRELIAVVSNGDYDDLKQEALTFKDSFTTAIEEFELECNDILRGTSFRSIKEEPLIQIFRRAITILGQFTELRGKVGFSVDGRVDIVIRTYTAELELVLKDLLRNILQHFEREKSVGVILIQVAETSDNRIKVSLADSIAAPKDIQKVIGIIDNPESRDSLHRHIKPTIERLLQGAIYAQKHPKWGSVQIVLILPKEVTVH